MKIQATQKSHIQQHFITPIWLFANYSDFTASLIALASHWASQSLRIPEDLDGVDIALPGPRHTLRAQFDALCATVGVSPRLRAEVDDMAMLRLIASDSGWLTLLPEVVVQDELRAGDGGPLCGIARAVLCDYDNASASD